ncbi:hypothetical protein BGZ46_007086 [Entomortierella lignicola]|nr:hypothetical protein BGZ46_007086 [Entomortierella lignicola]
MEDAWSSLLESEHRLGAPLGLLVETRAAASEVARWPIHETELDLGASDKPCEQVAIPSLPGSPIYSPSTSEEMDYLFHTPPPPPAFTQPPSPPRPEPRRRMEPLFDNMFQLEPVLGSEFEQRSLIHKEHPPRLPTPSDFQHKGHQPSSSVAESSVGSNHHYYPFEDEPRKPLTSIAGSSRCLWPPDSTFLTMSSTYKEQAYQRSSNIGPSGSNVEDISPHTSLSRSMPLSASTTAGLTLSDGFAYSQKSHIPENYKDSGDCMQELQPRRKARRVMDGGPYFKERNHRLVAGHVRKLIQEAVEDGVGELDLSNLELTDLPSEICDLNFAIVYNERGSFSLSNNRLKLFLSSNQFTTIPMDVFALHNLSVLSLRNNSIESIPPEIGLLHNLVELSVGGNLLKVLPSQIALLSKLHILTVHPNPFMIISKPEEVRNSAENHNEPPALNSAHGGNINIVTGTPEGHDTINVNDQIQHSIMHGLLISPPMSPTNSQFEDIDMSTPSEHDDTDSTSLSSIAVNSEIAFSNAMTGETLLTGESLSQGSASASSTSSIEPRNHVSLGDSRGTLPPHMVTRSRFPTLLVLAGNALLNYMEQRGVNDTAGKRKQAVEWPRKDSKVSMSEDELLETSPVDDCNRTQEAELGCKGLAAAYRPKSKYVFREDIIRSHLTPYLYDNFKRARTNNLCAGCKKRFWKPCRIVVIWQDILGQSSVPIEWRGCGIRGCSGVPASMWSSPPSVPALPEPSPLVSNSLSVASPSGPSLLPQPQIDNSTLPHIP